MVNEILEKIIEKNNNKEALLSEFAFKSKDAERIFKDIKEETEDYNIRNSFFRDVDRIIHALSYTRYIDKTQVYSFIENDHITHRVLHVQFVAKIARTICRALNLNEDLAEAIALGHDIGHSPFGHEGEYILDDICKENNIGRFHHNAQSFRNLYEIENKGKGLNLTVQVLDGILTHNGELLGEKYIPDKEKTKEVLLKQYRGLMTGEQNGKEIRPMTLEGCVVRISDIIAYIGRDIEDAILVNIIKREELPKEISEILGDKNDKIINTLVQDLIKNSYGKDHLSFTKEVYEALINLKKFNYEKIYNNPKKDKEERKLKKMFEDLFYKYLEDLNSENIESNIYKNYLNTKSSTYLNENSNKRIIIDHFAGMTDKFFLNVYNEEFIPKSEGSSFG